MTRSSRVQRWSILLLCMASLAPTRPAGAQVGSVVQPGDAQLLDEIREVVDAFEKQTRAYRRQVNGLVQRQYEERRAQLSETYEKAIRELEVVERQRRLEAIARFEAFLRHYPDNPQYTPDAMFRLAELYYERSYEQYLQAMREFDQQVKAFDRGETTDDPVMPSQHFEDSIALYQQLINRFPSYRLVDAAYYLLGYCLGEQGELESSIQTFVTLTEKYPDSGFYVEAWMRIGEFYFDADRLDEAVQAYTQVTTKGVGTKFYDKGLYKLAWTHYRLDLFDAAIREFLTLVDYADAEKLKGNNEAQSLRPESIQYVAISFADERWDRGIAYDFEADQTGEQMVDFAISYFASAGHRPYEPEIIERLGGILFDSAKYQGAVKALEYALDQAPLAPQAPRLQQKIVEAWERARQFDKATAARDKLFEKYAEKTPWYDANIENGEAIRAAQELTKNSVYVSAIFHHQQAQQYFQEQRLDLAKVSYEQAAKGYQRYLDRFPHDKQAYELRFYLADCYFYSLDFMNAADAYRYVRDSTAGDKYRNDAALGVIFAYQEEIKRLEKAGKLEARKVLTGGREGDTLPAAEEIPTLRTSYIQACDRFVELAPQHERVPVFSYTSAETFYVYNHFDEATKRFEQIIEKYPTDEVAKFAANLIIELLLAKKDWVAVEKFAQMVQQRRVGDTEAYKKFEVGALFNKASQYNAEGEKLLSEGKAKEGNAKLEAAAAEYVRLVSENPKHEFADKALFNAAVAYERVRRFESAARLYERVFDEYPQSDLADKSLFLVALKSEQAFDFDKAIDKYLRLVKDYPKSTDRANALFNAALALENTQQYERAAREYERYASMFSDREDAPETFYRAAIVHEKREDKAAMVSTLFKFIQKYRKDARQGDRVVEALGKIATYYDEAGKDSDATKYYESAVKEFAARGLAPATRAGYFAAKARFALIEKELKRYETIKIEGDGKNQQKQLALKAERLKKVEDQYRTVLDYKQIEWSLASLYRMGFLYENLAETMVAADCPKDIKRLGQEYCDEYKVLLEDKAAELEQKIVPAYELAYNEAIKAKVINEWTKRTLEGLNKYRKAQYPIDKEPLGRMVPPLSTGAGLVIPDEVAARMGAGRQMEGK
ncbi:MAG: tetratricopeptide repeat protein [Pseudomonadota bacterium]